MRWAAFAAALLVAGCDDGDAPGSQSVATSARDEVVHGATVSGKAVIAGAWRLRTAGGAAVRNREAVILTVDDTIVMKAGCVEREWHYRVEGGNVLTQEEGRLTCLRPLTPAEEQLSNTVARGFVVIEGDADDQHWRGMGGEVTLIRTDAPWVEPSALPIPDDIPMPPPAPRMSEIAPPPPPPIPRPAPASLIGEWRLAGVDGKPLVGSRGIAVHIGRDRIEFDNCQQIAWRYTYAAPAIAIRRTPAVTIDIAPKPLPCAASLPPQLSAMVRAIDAATRVEMTPENGVRLSGEAGSVLLFRQ
ncbi:hypothetical protein EKN06_09410 [Croceicoccus ponticola]|uniref:META domain-containing protein n=1 Tax=Croceicoccus ponticola TaxID=2217664 RepID=A0A437GXJ5_9SPHN|nr:hypothetical protein [Croceicoccus ponticola]RVQ67125.1 hypothetical protein EKN06_09410 [Croceicoccus ponticola]